MGLIKSQIQKQRTTHYWSMVWGRDDWGKKENIDIFVKIHAEYTECLKFWKNNKSSKLYATDLYQIRNGGMTEDGAIIWDTAKAESGEYQTYQINQFMLDKYFSWRDMNMLQDEKYLENARCKEIHKEIIHLLKNLNLKTI